jgi:hypothetical protein
MGPWAQFQVPLESDSGWPIFIKGGYSSSSRKLQFSLIWQGHGRIYGLCVGSGHTNLSRERLESPHKHRWTEHDPQHAYSPKDITATDPLTVWEQFCSEATIRHLGRLAPPPPIQTDLL